jgi:hypothetical protein
VVVFEEQVLGKCNKGKFGLFFCFGFWVFSFLGEGCIVVAISGDRDLERRILRGGRNHGGGGGWKTVELKETKVCFKRGNKQWRAEKEEGAEARARKEREGFFMVYISHVSKEAILRKQVTSEQQHGDRRSSSSRFGGGIARRLMF